MKKVLLMAVLGFGISFSPLVKGQSARDMSSTFQKADDGAVVIYPTAAKDILTMRTRDAAVKIKNITFYSILGTPVYSVNANVNLVDISLDKLKPGKYLVRYLLSDNSQKVTQIIKQ